MNERIKQRMGASVAMPFLVTGMLVGACTTENEDVSPTLATTDQAIAQQMSVDSQYMIKTVATKTTPGAMNSVDFFDEG
jgi:hypothetical protein